MQLRLRSALAFALVCFAADVGATAYYISPSGSNSNDGLSTGAPKKTFSHVFGLMAAGDTLYLMDGTYSVAAGTGVMDPNGTNSAMPPSGTNISTQTTVAAVNPGSVKVLGYAADEYSGTPLRVGSGASKRSYITIDGITFSNYGTGNVTSKAGWLYNTSYVTIKNCGFIGAFAIGTSDGPTNTRNLVQDVWIASKDNRINAINYRAHENVWRRVLVRGDGCALAGCLTSGNPNVGITIYDSHDVSFQNVMVIDRILGGGEPYADFASAGVTVGHELGRNSWLGVVSLDAPDTGIWFDGDTFTAETNFTLTNAVSWQTDSGVYAVNASHGTMSFQNLTVKAGSGTADGVRLAPQVTTSGSNVTNIEVAGAGRNGINSVVLPMYCNVFGAAFAYSQTTCVTGATTDDALTNGALEYILRIEDGSTLDGTGSGGADKGANIIYKYGTDGTRFGDSGYNTLTANPLWPWPNQARILQEMCTDLSITRGFCAGGGVTLTSYIWNYLGNGSPYEGAAVAVTTTSLPQGTVGATYAGTACLVATGGIGAPFTWSVTAGSLPTSVTLGSDGCWSGTPSVANTFNFTVQACDATPTCDTQAETIIITAAPTLDVATDVASTTLLVRYGKAGLPFSDDCDAVLKIGETTQSTQTTTEGFSRRYAVFTGLTASTAYNVDIACTSATAERVTVTTKAAAAGGDRTVPIALRAVSLLSTAARVTVEYATNATLTSSTSVQNTSCGSGCTVNLTLAAGVYYYRHKWQTSGDTVIATSLIQPLIVP